MRLFDKVKQYVFAATTILAVGAVAVSGMTASAKTINDTKETTKQVTTIGSGDTFDNVTNLKINGKKYTKGSVKKKVATVKYATNARAYKAWTGSYTEYYDDDTVYNEETYKKERQNYKWISTSNYDLTFLKAGTYKISYDTYSYYSSNPAYKFGGSYSDTNDEYDFYRLGDGTYAQYQVSADTKTAKVTPVLFKTQHVDTYKVVQTTNGLKVIALGKSKQTNTVSKSGTKSTYKTIYKNRFLSGKSGKVKYTMNSNYTFTSAFAVTRDAAGNIKIAAAGKNANIAYSQGVYTKNKTYDEYILDANGKKTYKVDPVTGKETNEYATKEVVTGTKKTKYKYTDIYYGYKDKYTGAYTKYGVSSRTVYLHKKDENDNPMYQKNADGTYVLDEDGDKIPVMEAVAATVLTKEYPEYDWVNGSYVKIVVIDEIVLLPEDLTADKKFDLSRGTHDNGNYEQTRYYLDEKRTESDYSNEWREVSRNGISEYVLNANGEYVYNPVYGRTFYNSSYRGSWTVYNKATMDWENCDGYDDTYYADYVVNADGTRTYTYYAYVYELDAKGNKIKKAPVTNHVYFNGTSGHSTFKAK